MHPLFHLTQYTWKQLLVPCLRKEKEDTSGKRLCSLPKIVQLVSG